MYVSARYGSCSGESIALIRLSNLTTNKGCLSAGLICLSKELHSTHHFADSISSFLKTPFVLRPMFASEQRQLQTCFGTTKTSLQCPFSWSCFFRNRLARIRCPAACSEHVPQEIPCITHQDIESSASLMQLLLSVNGDVFLDHFKWQ